MKAQRGGRRAALISLGVLAAVAAGLRLATHVADRPAIWDEKRMSPVIEALTERGWTVETAIDYQDTKGPAFFWLYGAAAEITGPDVTRLRPLSAALFALCGIPLGLVAARCGVRGWSVALLAFLWALLPYNAVLGQLFMSEPSFMLGGLALGAVFMWGVGDLRHAGHPVAGPILFGALVAVLLHHRVHAVAWALAAVLVAVARLGPRGAWPWLAACAAAGASRLPLYLRWGGFVSGDYQERLGLGLSPESLVYLAATLAPVTAVLTVPIVTSALRRRRWRAVAGVSAAAVAGLVLGLVAAPDISETALDGKPRFDGMVATTVGALGPDASRAAIAILAAAGSSGLAAALQLALRRPVATATGAAERLAAWSLAGGWAMYAFTRGVVYDRYALPFMILLPLLWLRRLPKWALAAESIVLLAIAGRQVAQRLF